MKKCENIIGNITGYTLKPTTKFDKLFENNWQKRVDTINQTMQQFGFTVEYGDFSPYFANNPKELAEIIKQYKKPYIQLKEHICSIFQNVFDVQMRRQITINTPLYTPNSMVARLNPNISDYTFLQFQTELENAFGIVIPNPGETTQKLNTLKKWCDYIAEFKGIQIPQNRR